MRKHKNYQIVLGDVMEMSDELMNSFSRFNANKREANKREAFQRIACDNLTLIKGEENIVHI